MIVVDQRIIKQVSDSSHFSDAMETKSPPQVSLESWIIREGDEEKNRRLQCNYEDDEMGSEKESGLECVVSFI